MPELPEVEVIRMGLEPHLVGRRLERFYSSGKALRTPVPVKELSTLCGGQITAVRRRAKYLLFDLDSGELLVFHLGMTGNLGLFLQGTPRRLHDHLEFMLDDSTLLRYHDPRRFGRVAVLAAGDETARQVFFRTSGPEPLGEHFTAQWLKEKARRRKISVKPFIMSSEVVVGIGNIYANESLFAAGIRPQRSVAKITMKEWQQLVECIRKTLRFAIECGGSTISDFRSVDQQSGYFQMNFQVYGRAGEPCKRCGRHIEKEVLGGRSSCFCRNCQK
ncbi:bifunctional DNA-formamidopyrimidine glycosylase/DNA-(apurinic or apyrimidinic site) lyase [Desulforhopalus vacuolatus]|uniref:bifunctional DNA-formamidopyrimidine glycosylase/DNA-(apurinic or apyrimidinic site) lyase n=1 Tax=Desulforhopalus vacuolatus TaxID=40414 RepID=UPI0019633A2A|nr:bifunctional DNA-formamidopyrimidine glycosylase/DNA-(apurinic or apyrimidinic site) lyase [Desulforhopalus vacuolatus]MBM9519348.1 bifunctional DNA-formamidopyrimidine glycosylase/DNA-(apurinic or apyrimidinic site) lyase [Desulforhopalus vacuolatus]